MFMVEVISNMPVGATAIRRGQICKVVAGLVVPCSVLGEAFFGIAKDDYRVGEPTGSFVVTGEAEVEVADAASIIGSIVRTDANGRAVPTAAASQSVGLLLEPGAALISGISAYSRVIVRAHNVIS